MWAVTHTSTVDSRSLDEAGKVHFLSCGRWMTGWQSESEAPARDSDYSVARTWVASCPPPAYCTTKYSTYFTAATVELLMSAIYKPLQQIKWRISAHALLPSCVYKLLHVWYFEVTDLHQLGEYELLEDKIFMLTVEYTYITWVAMAMSYICWVSVINKQKYNTVI